MRERTVVLLNTALVFRPNLQPSSISTSDEMPSAEPATRLAGSAEMRLAVLARTPFFRRACLKKERPGAHGVSVIFIVPESPFPIRSHAHEQWERSDSSDSVSLRNRKDKTQFIRKKSGWVYLCMSS